MKKRDEQGRTRAERIIDEGYRSQRNAMVATAVVTSAVMFPLGLLVGWLTGG